MTTDNSKEPRALAEGIDRKPTATNPAQTENDGFVYPLALAALKYRNRASADCQPVPLDRGIDEIPDWVLGGG